jgi:Fic-DOC domain mobile mystery protein B
MGLDLVYGKGQTPLSEEEKEGLLLKHISTQGELNEAEQLNIEEAVQWTLGRRFPADVILSEEFTRELHNHMYREIWGWAGDFRKSEKNLGIENCAQIPIELRKLIDDSKFWVDRKTYPEDEIAVRFKHRIVSIHCFPNGNGRHSRLMADVIISNIFEKPVFAWGAATYKENKTAREDYIRALQDADKGNLGPLMRFARS